MKVLLLSAVLLAVLHVTNGAEKRHVARRVAPGANANSIAHTMSLGAGNSFRQGRSARTAKGSNRQSMTQTYGGLDVVGTNAEVEVSNQGNMRGIVSGTIAYNLEEDIADPQNDCTHDLPELMTRAINYLETVRGLTIPAALVPEQVKWEKKVRFFEDEGVGKLVYDLHFLIRLQPTPCRPFFQFLACTQDLDVVEFFDKIHNATLAVREKRQEEQCDTTTAAPTAAPTPPTGACPASAPAQGKGGNGKTGEYSYGVDLPRCLYTEVAGSTCTMRNNYAIVLDLENGYSSSGKSPVNFNCATGYNDPANGAFGVANDAFYFGDSTSRVFEDWYNLPEPLGFAPILRVHYGNNYCNAFWDGSQMTFGDGCSSLYPLVSSDVVGHELGHGVTDRYSDLYYSAQSGGINEAFSDMTGEIVELYSFGSHDWQVGRELFKYNAALRYFETPSDDGQSIDFADEYTQGMDVHYSSGCFNRAYYQLVTAQGFTLRQAFEVFLQANRVFWTQTTNFQQGACGAMKAAYDLGYDTEKVKAAFAAVRITLTAANCPLGSNVQSVESGETRSNVQVSNMRNPVFQVDVPVGVTVVIDTVTQNDQEVIVSVTKDLAGTDVVLSGPTPFVFDTTEDTAFFKVSSATDDDINVEITLEVMA